MPHRTRRFCFTIWLHYNTSVGGSLGEKKPISKLEIFALAIPMMQYEFLVILDHLLTNRANSILHSVYFCHEFGCNGLNLLFISILKVRILFRIEWVGRPLYFDMPLLFNQLANLDQTDACVGIGKLVTRQNCRPG